MSSRSSPALCRVRCEPGMRTSPDYELDVWCEPGWSGSWQPECVITIRRVGLEDLREVVGAIDRSEHVDGEYAVVGGRLRNNAPGRAFYRRKLDEGKSRKEALRALKRQIAKTCTGTWSPTLTVDLR